MAFRLPLVLIAMPAAVASAQNAIPDSGLTLELAEVATLPDSGSGNAAPPRISVVTEDPAGRVFASDQRGVLYHVDVTTGTVTEYLDLRDYPALTVVSTSEAGFQSFAFHPDFHLTGADGFGCFYTIHSCSVTTSAPDFDPGGLTSFHTLLLEWKTATPGAIVFSPAVPASPYRELIRFDQPFGNHNSGLIAFNPLATPGDPDHGNLYVAIGDGGSANDPQNNARNPANPYGAILRINPLGSDSANGKYGIVATNALAADGLATTLGEIYAYGLRNPQRYGWDLVTGNAFLADIGQGFFEEINLLTNGANYGWDLVEGGGGSPTYTDPVAGYFHTTDFPGTFAEIGNRAVTCSDVFRGTCVGGFDGILLVADFPNGRVFRLNVDTDPLDGGIDGLSEIRFKDGPSGTRTLLIDLINTARAARSLSATSRTDVRFSVNTPGRVFVSNKHDGILRRVVPDQSPAVSLGSGGTLGYTGLLETSTDLSGWSLAMPQPEQDEPVDYDTSHRFFRGIRR